MSKVIHVAKNTTSGKTAAKKAAESNPSQEKPPQSKLSEETSSEEKPSRAKPSEGKASAAKPSARRKKPTGKVDDAQIAESSADTTKKDANSPDADLKTSETAASESAEDAGVTANQNTAKQTTVETNDSPSAKEDVSSAAASEDTPRQSSNPIALVFGGVIAGAIGFFAAYVGFGLNQTPPPEPVDLSGIEQSIEVQSGRLDELAASIPEASEPPDLSGLTSQLDTVSDTLSALETRVTALENRAPGAAAETDPALLDDLDQLKSTIAALEAENEAAKASARSAAEATLRRAAMTRVQTALDTGASFAAAAAELSDLGVSVPDILSQNAANGVTSLASLQESFPDAARAALTADREAASEAGETGGLSGFLRSQLGARSLTPQEGDSTDAVLSRAEAALREGRLADTLAELETLPEVAQPAMSAWAELASARASAVNAAQTLSDSLN
ncbi:MAG: hypothetical protein AAFY35_17285 [Pseudomonadota bacterium]